MTSSTNFVYNKTVNLHQDGGARPGGGFSAPNQVRKRWFAMGFLSSLFSGYSSDLLPETPAGKKLADFPELYKGMTLSVILPDGSSLLTGKLTDFTTSEITIERLPGWLAFDTCPVHKEVTVRGYNKSMAPFCLKGAIQESTRIVCKLRDIKVEPIAEQRYNFRLALSCPASLFYESDEHLKNPEECTLVDISTGGACIESEFLHGEGEVLRLRTKIEDYAPMTFLGQIIRVMECQSGKFHYGFLFAQLTEEEITELTRTLYNIQLGNRKAWSRGPEGNWS